MDFLAEFFSFPGAWMLDPGFFSGRDCLRFWRSRGWGEKGVYIEITTWILRDTVRLGGLGGFGGFRGIGVCGYR